MNYVDKNGLSRFYSKIQSLFALKTSIPTKVSQLSNDSGYQAANNVNTTLSSYAKKSELPTKVSQLTNDSGFITEVPNEYVTETELNAKGYQNSTQVNSAITSKGYQTASQVESAITSKGYITEADIASQTTTITIAASAWSADGKYTVSDNRITATSNQEFCFPVYNGEEDDEMFDAIEAAKIRNGGQSNGSAILWCQGDIPTIQIKLDIIFRGEK